MSASCLLQLASWGVQVRCLGEQWMVGPKEKLTDEIVQFAREYRDEILAEMKDAQQQKPYINKNGILVIPFDCPKRYKWWQGGQSVEQTINELIAEQQVVHED